MITIEERRHIHELNAKNDYGLSRKMILTLVTKHKKAYEKGDIHEMEKIEYRLTDLNFHYECGLLGLHNYEEIYDAYKK